MYGLKNVLRPRVHKAKVAHTTSAVDRRPTSTLAGGLPNIKDGTTRIEVSDFPEEPLRDVASTNPSLLIRRVSADVNNASRHRKGLGLRRNRGENTLPISPFMDPTYGTAKSRHMLPKAERSKNPTPFQQRLAQNVYARALLAPVRHCAFTDTWLPSYFLQKFDLITYPKTGEHWYLPRSLVRHPSTIPTVSSTNLQSGYSEETDSNIYRKLGPGKYILARQSLLAATNQKQSGFTNKWQHVFPPTRAKRYIAFDQGKLRWRADIDTFVLKLLRFRVVEHLKYLAEKKVYLVQCADFANATAMKRLGAILWFGEVSNADKSQGILSIGEFATLDTGRQIETKTPVHNMRALLGDDLVQELEQNCPFAGADLVGLRHRNMTISLQLKLWKLQGYVAELGDFTGLEASGTLAGDLSRTSGETDEDVEDYITPAPSDNFKENFVSR